MKNLFRKKSFKILLGVVVILIGLIIYSSQVGNSITANIISFISSPIQKGSSSAVNSVSDAIQSNDTKLQTEKIAELESEVRDLKDQLLDYYDCKRQVEEYRQMLEIKETHADMQMLSASVIGVDSSDLFGTFSIDLGTLDGIHKGDPVITADGLVGWISKAYNTTAVVTTIYSENTRIGATSKDKRETGIIESNIKLRDLGCVSLSYLDGKTKIAAEDIITTTGLSGLFPKDIIIGSVQSIETASDGISKYAVVKPYVDIDNLSDVFVVTDFYGKGSVSTDKLYDDSSDASSLDSSSSDTSSTGDTSSSDTSSSDTSSLDMSSLDMSSSDMSSEDVP